MDLESCQRLGVTQEMIGHLVLRNYGVLRLFSGTGAVRMQIAFGRVRRKTAPTALVSQKRIKNGKLNSPKEMKI